MKVLKRFLAVIFLSCVILFIFSNGNTAYGFSYIKPAPENINSSGYGSVKNLTAKEFIKLSAHDFSVLTGKKLNVFQRLFFTIAKMRVKHDLKKNPDLKITDYLDKEKKGNSFNFTWLLLGIAGPLIGLLTGIAVLFAIISVTPVVVAYATKQDRIKKKSVWVGFGITILLLAILAAILITALGI
jgi:hypothetical protein